MAEVQKDLAKEKKMLVTSADLFAKFGFREAKTDDIAQQAEVSKGLVFHYFGNKQKLYLATYDYAAAFFYDRMDYSVWQKAADLVEMVVAATKYKIQLQLDYPVEFNFLMRAFSEMSTLPKELQAALSQRINHDFTVNLTIADPVIEKLSLKAGVTQNEVKDLLILILNAESIRIQQELAQHPEWQSMADLEPIIQRLKKELEILQFGFLAE